MFCQNSILVLFKAAPMNSEAERLPKAYHSAQYTVTVFGFTG
jgi:hypothetical protein